MKNLKVLSLAVLCFIFACSDDDEINNEEISEDNFYIYYEVSGEETLIVDSTRSHSLYEEAPLEDDEVLKVLKIQFANEEGTYILTLHSSYMNNDPISFQEGAFELGILGEPEEGEAFMSVSFNSEEKGFVVPQEVNGTITFTKVTPQFIEGYFSFSLVGSNFIEQDLTYQFSNGEFRASYNEQIW